MNVELKPCPFCGSTNLTSEENYVICINCQATGPSNYHDFEDGPDSPAPHFTGGTFDNWNSRV